MAFRMGREAVERTDEAGVTVDAVVKPDQHQAAANCTLFLQPVEVVLQRLLLGRGIVNFNGNDEMSFVLKVY